MSGPGKCPALTSNRVSAALRLALLVQLQLMPQKLHGSCELAHHHLRHAACFGMPGDQVQQARAAWAR